MPRPLAERARELAAAGSHPRSRARPRPSSCSASVPASRRICCAAPGRWNSRRAPACSRADPSTSGTPTRRSAGRPDPADFAGLLGTSPERARALICAAVRETFEEAGVLLAGPAPAVLLDDSAGLAEDRHGLLEGLTSFGELLSRRGLLLRADLLTPWARWITPEASPRRFDTWFFAAAVPPGQSAGLASPAEQHDRAAQVGSHGPGESDSGIWLRPAAALELARTGEITLLPPTAVTLGELAAHQDLTGILTQRRVMTPRLPKVMIDGERAWLAVPDQPRPEQPSA